MAYPSKRIRKSVLKHKLTVTNLMVYMYPDGSYRVKQSGVARDLPQIENEGPSSSKTNL